jgi:hypothetical protein
MSCIFANYEKSVQCEKIWKIWKKLDLAPKQGSDLKSKIKSNLENPNLILTLTQNLAERKTRLESVFD